MLSFRQFLACVLAAFTLAGTSLGQAEEDFPEAPRPAKGARITFLPPPIEGTITLGLFDPAGKLVHVLKQEATEDDFTVGLNGFITHWEGTDGAGKPLPKAEYHARGYAVGDVEVEGIAFHGNDWLSTEESPRLTRVVQLALDANGALMLKAAEPANVQTAHFRYDAGKDQLVPLEKDAAFPESRVRQLTPDSDPQQAAAAGPEGGYLLETGKLWTITEGKALAVEYPGLARVVSACPGRDSTLWAIDETPDGSRMVKQFSATGELLRALPPEAGDPPPVQIVADPAKDAIHLLEVSATTTRVRSLVLEKLEPAADGGIEAEQVSTWRTVLSKSITSSGEFSEAIVSELRGAPFPVAQTISVRLLPNPLFRNQPANVELKIAATAEGAVLQTANGLPLKKLTATRGLRWAALSREPGTKAILMIQSDGAVVEEFRIRRLGHMMAFDAGTYEVKP